ncbi:MAG: insulinase family protein [Bdellovibrionales bacterium]|nr:insulinase family protein [Bdellovibrionales bacterium]
MKLFGSLLSLLICLFSLNCQSASYQKVAEHTLFNGDKLTEFRLENGLQVLHVPRHQAKVLTYQVWFRVGSLDEKLDAKLKKTGLAHLFEHMMFRGTAKYPDGVFDKLISRMGGTGQNASTYFYRTNYYESVPSDQLEALMTLESDRMQNLQITPALFEREKGAVVGELRRHLDSPVSVGFDQLLDGVFKVAPFRFTVLGSEKEIKGFTLEEANYFYKTYYAPNNATLIVIGDVDAGKLMSLVTKYYGEMKSQEVPRHKVPEEPPQTKERKIYTRHKQATSDSLLVGYRIPTVSSPDFTSLALLATHLSTGMEGRLRKLLVDPGIAVSANGAPSSRPDLFEFVVSLSEKHRAEQALAIIDQEVARLQKKQISEKDFQRALNQEKLDMYGNIGSNSSLANMLGEYLVLSGDYLLGFKMLSAFEKLTPVDLQKAAKQHLNKNQRTIVVIRPAKRGGKKS